MMADANEPMTPMTIEQLKRHMDRRFSRCATKRDLQRFATKDDLKQFATKDHLKRFATKDDLKGLATKEDLKRYATKDDLNDLQRFIRKEFARWTDVILKHYDRILDNHERRITDLESRPNGTQRTN